MSYVDSKLTKYNNYFKKSEQLSKGGKVKEVASVAVIDKDNSKILMGKRRDNGRWTLPGGHMENEETPIITAHRELKEEAGIRSKNMVYLGTKRVKCEDGVDRTIHSFVMYGKPNTSGKLDPDKEVSDWVWVPINNNRIPASVENNLHSPKNVTLNLLGLQEKI